jgi:hypothetical protein
VVAQQAHVQIHHQIDTLGRIGPISDDIAKAIDLFDAALSDIRQHGLQCFKIAVYVADQRSQGSHPGIKRRVLI